MQYGWLNAMWLVVQYLRNGVPGWVIRLVKAVRSWRSVMPVIMLLVVLMVTGCVPISAAPAAAVPAPTMTATPVPTEVVESVVCIGVVLDGAGRQHAFFQRAGDTIEQTLTEQGMEALVREGFTVQHKKCFETWQQASDWLTDGAVTLPDNATEQDFITALMEWKRQRLLSQY